MPMNEQDLKAVVVLASVSAGILAVELIIAKRSLKRKQKLLQNCFSALELSHEMMGEMVEKNPDTKLSQKTVDGINVLNIMMRNGF